MNFHDQQQADSLRALRGGSPSGEPTVQRERERTTPDREPNHQSSAETTKQCRGKVPEWQGAMGCFGVVSCLDMVVKLEASWHCNLDPGHGISFTTCRSPPQTQHKWGSNTRCWGKMTPND